MKTSVSVILAIAGLSAFVGKVTALPISDPVYQDIDSFGVSLNAKNPSQSGTFDITSRPSDGSPSVTINNSGNANNRYVNTGVTYNDILGFQPGGSQTILSANAYFYIQGANGNNDILDIDLTGFLNDTEDRQGNGSHIIFGGGLDTGAINVLNNNGVLSYTVSRDDGSFTFDYAQLQVVTAGLKAQGDPVPDGGSTAGMLGCAFLLTGVVARRFKS